MKQITVEGTTVQLIEDDSIRCVLPWQANVGESPVWHAAEQKLYWIDIQEKQIHRLDPATGVNESVFKYNGMNNLRPITKVLYS